MSIELQDEAEKWLQEVCNAQKQCQREYRIYCIRGKMVLQQDNYRIQRYVRLEPLPLCMLAFRLLVLSAAILIIFCSECWSAATQQLQTVFPLPASSKTNSAVMYYQKLGVAFVLRDLRFGGIERVYVFPPSNHTSQAELSRQSVIGDDEVVPG